MVNFKGAHFQQEIILTCVRWYLAYPLSYRHLEDMMQERGVHVDHSTVQRWVVKYTPQLEKAFHQKKRSVESSWRLDETYIKVKGQWKYLYRVVDKSGQTIDFMLTARRDEKAARRFLNKAIRRQELPEKITIDKSGSNTAAIEGYNIDHQTRIELHQIKYLNNIVEQDHRAIKRIVRPMMGFKSFRSAHKTLVGIEIMHMIKKGQLADNLGSPSTPAAHFHSLAA